MLQNHSVTGGFTLQPRHWSIHDAITLYSNDNVFEEKTSITFQQLNAIEQISFQSLSGNR